VYYIVNIRFNPGDTEGKHSEHRGKKLFLIDWAIKDIKKKIEIEA